MRIRSRIALAVCLLGSSLSSPDAVAIERSSGDFVYVTEKVEVPPGTGANLIAQCPDGTRAVGAGGGVSRPAAALTYVAPHDDGDVGFDEDGGAIARAWNGTSKPVRLTSVAICSLGMDAAGITYNRVSQVQTAATSAATSNAYCDAPSTEVALGGGGGVQENPYDRLAASFPDGNLWFHGIRGVNPSDRTMTGVVACLQEGIRTLTVRSRTFALRAGERGTFRVACPKSKRVTGGGARFGNVLEITRSAPFDGDDDRDRTADDGWIVTVRNTSASGIDAEVGAVCVGRVDV